MHYMHKLIIGFKLILIILVELLHLNKLKLLKIFTKSILLFLFYRLDTNGHIFEDTITQLYCEKHQSFLADRFVEGTCPLCGYEVLYINSRMLVEINVILVVNY